ncbi:DUF3953 domain-containing protein [Radiobacillus deserti]|uniref:DUF3953 domain-containing protein n=1 Tax=Radiobacillus deserti TaxID=2594883 RepID=A0A516KJG6_9BACI|nr:DUF3953 domain-containing protein [Radiobacillus deserti]QDP41533.1 DUF3953 domain-containing protein [Radiobacillus deserti]
MLNILRIILAVIVIAISGYGLITNDKELLHFMLLSLGALMFVIGIKELKKDKKGIWGYLSSAIFAFTWFTSIQIFLSY